MNSQEFNLAAELGAFLQEDKFKLLVESFYARVAKHPVLAPLFPEGFSEVKEKQHRFLTQFFGGAPLYSERYGQPAMRQIHSMHKITPTAARAWVACMQEALQELDAPEEVRQFILDRLSMVAPNFINTPE